MAVSKLLQAHQEKDDVIPRRRGVPCAARTCSRFVLVVAALVVPLTPTRFAAAQQQEGGAIDASVDRAEQLYADMTYQEANDAAQKILKERSGLSHRQVVRLYRILALSYAVLERPNEAREAYVFLLSCEPDFQLESGSAPRVSGPYYEAKGFLQNQRVKPGIEVSPALSAGGSNSLRISVRDPAHIAKNARIAFRWGKSPFQTKTVSIGDGTVVPLPARPRDTSSLAYFAQAFDDRNNIVFEMGTESRPVTATVTADTKTSKPTQPAQEEASPSRMTTLSWIGLGATGALAIGAAVTGVLALDASKELQDTRFVGAAPSSIESKRTEVQGLSIATDVLGAAAIVTLATTLVLTFVRSPTKESRPHASIFVRSVRGGPGLQGAF